MVTIRKATKTETPKGKALYIVSRDGKDVGTIWKPRNTKTDIYPWSVYHFGNPIAVARFYNDADSVKIGPAFDYEKCKIGGKTAAFIYARRIFV